MTTHLPVQTRSLDSLCHEALRLKLLLAEPAAELRAVTDEIKKRAADDTANLTDTESGGKSWSRPVGDGHAVVVSFPVPTRVKLDDDAVIRKIAGDQFRHLFTKSTTWQAVKDFAAKVAELLPKSHAKKLAEIALEATSAKLDVKLAKKGNA